MISTSSFTMALFSTLMIAAGIKPPEPVYNGPDAYTQRGADLSVWFPYSEENPWEASGLIEGDIMLSKFEDIRNVILDEEKYWPNGIVPYYIDEDQFSEEERSQIHDALKKISERTCIVIREFQEGDQDFVKIKGNSTGCWSYVGRKHGGQVVNLQPPACLRPGTIVHEFLHALGFYHQHSAHDRDTYIEIRWENVRPGQEHNFRKYNETAVTDFGVGYDYDSVMHYSRTAFSVNHNQTIVPKFPNAVIGQREGLSEKDIKKLNKTYKCNENINTSKGDFS